MSYLLQSAYIAILSPIYRLTRKIDDAVRNTILFVLFLIVFVYFACVRSPILSPAVFGFLPTLCAKHLFGIALIILICIFSIDRPLQHVEWKKIIFIPQFVLGLGIVIIGFLHPIGDGYQTFGFMLLIVFPCLFFVWNNRRDYDLLFSILVYAMIVVNLCLFLLHFYYAAKGQLTIETVRCAGIMYNSNNFSLVGLELVLGATYLLAVQRPKLPLFILSCSAAGVGFGIIVLGQMRLAVIILFLCLFTVIFFYIKYCDKKSEGVFVRLFVGVFLIVQLLLLSFLLIPINNAAILSNTDVGQETTGQTVVAPESPGVVERFDVEGKDANSFSSGRVTIWKNYARALNLLGNNYDEYDKDIMTSGLSHGPYAHDIFLEIGYRCGIPVGLLSVFMLLVTGILALTYLFCNRNRTSYLLFPIIAVISYAVLSLLDCAVLPFFQAEVLLYYFAMIVFIDAQVNK